MNPTAKSFILDLLSTLRGGAMPVRALIAAAEHFDIADNSIRVALARLLAEGRVARDDRGQYALGVQAEAMRRQVTTWRTLDDRVVRWDGGWIGVHRSTRRPRLTGPEVRRRARALRFLGFRTLEPGFNVRPDNLRGGVTEMRAQLHALGLEAEGLVFVVDQFDPATEERALALWDVAALRAGYRRSISMLAQSERRLPQLAERHAMTEAFRLGGQVIRQLVLDPLLPEPLVPAAERTALLDAMRRYDRLGRACWAGFMRASGAPHRHAPADTRMAHEEDWLRTAAVGGTR
ncbi:MAG TPA: PaaX family transcriptional regulator C-terminal domain-containing protein [Candidatus Binatia bacterium]|nr:PaaX family transcriptional regulator C-terminal domain-containing protein [Candidatus Binatia bacterium]